MKLANTIFAISIGVYYVFGVYTSLLWSDFYYSVVFGYICSLVSNSKMIIFDKYFSYIIAITIWGLYLIKQIIPLEIFNWVRFVTGFIFVVMAVIYYFIKRKNKDESTRKRS